jgi:hypothetical protein
MEKYETYVASVDKRLGRVHGPRGNGRHATAEEWMYSYTTLHSEVRKNIAFFFFFVLRILLFFFSFFFFVLRILLFLFLFSKPPSCFGSHLAIWLILDWIKFFFFFLEIE